MSVNVTQKYESSRTVAGECGTDRRCVCAPTSAAEVALRALTEFPALIRGADDVNLRALEVRWSAVPGQIATTVRHLIYEEQEFRSVLARLRERAPAGVV